MNSPRWQAAARSRCRRYDGEINTRLTARQRKTDAKKLPSLYNRRSDAAQSETPPASRAPAGGRCRDRPSYTIVPEELTMHARGWSAGLAGPGVRYSL